MSVLLQKAGEASQARNQGAHTDNFTAEVRLTDFSLPYLSETYWHLLDFRLLIFFKADEKGGFWKYLEEITQ